jgi:hypothetical protein
MMSDVIQKFRMLTLMLTSTYHDWKSEVWQKDLDSLYCCDGRECGCDGETIREQWTMIFKGKAT